MNDRLPLHEEVLLLALRDEEGTVAMGTLYKHAIGAAILSELILRGRLTVHDTGRRKYAEVADRQPTGLPILDECLGTIDESKRKTLEQWVGKLAAIKHLKHRVAERLCDRGILREEEGTILLLFSRRIYPETDSRPEHEIVARLRQAVFTDNRTVDPRTVVLLSLTDATGILAHVFDKRELATRKERIEQVVSGELVGKAARDAVEAMQTAVLVASVMPAVIAATTTN